MKSSCDACHAGNMRDEIEEVGAAISSHEKKGDEAAKAKNLLNTVLLDKSSGAHNYQKAVAMLDEAMEGFKK